MARALPENSLAALREAMVHADGIEFDLRMTRDGHLVLHHDRTPMIPKHEKDYTQDFGNNHKLNFLCTNYRNLHRM